MQRGFLVERQRRSRPAGAEDCGATGGGTSAGNKNHSVCQRRSGQAGTLRSDKRQIELAGGVTDEADMDRVNLAQLCKDGGHIKVPRLSKARLKQKMQERKSAKETGISGEITGNTHYDDAAQNHSQKRAQEKWETADGSQSAATGWPEMQPDGNRREEKTESNAANAVLVHLNSATETDLIQLPGVGNATARRIIAFRNKHGFHRIEDIMQVPGIGPAKFARMKRCLAL